MEDEASGEPVAGEVASAATSPDAPAPAQMPAVRRQPLWTYFLTPIAVIIGSGIIAGAVWYTSDDPTSPAADHDGMANTGSPVSSIATVAGTPVPQDLLSTLKGYVKQLGMDEARFTQCLAKPESVALVNKQLQRGNALGITGTPTFFVNNKMIVGAQPAAIFNEVIAAELKSSPSSLDVYSPAVRQLAASSPPNFQILASRPDVADAVFEGNPNARVVIAEFSDFQCPFCKKWNDDNLKQIRAQLGTDVSLAFLHFPIMQIHANAGNTAVASVCANEQGKFWPMHDLLFQRQAEWAQLKTN